MVLPINYLYTINNIYNISEFNNVLENVYKHKKICDININLIYKILCKYISFKDDKFIINTKEPSYYTYKVLKEILKTLYQKNYHM